MATGCIRKERTQAAHPRSAKWIYRGTLPTQSRTRATARGNVLRARSWHGDYAHVRSHSKVYQYGKPRASTHVLPQLAPRARVAAPATAAEE